MNILGYVWGRSCTTRICTYSLLVDNHYHNDNIITMVGVRIVGGGPVKGLVLLCTYFSRSTQICDAKC